MIRFLTILVFVILKIQASFAQEAFRGLAEHALSLKLEQDSVWVHEFGISNRNLIYRNQRFGVQAEFLELSHATGRKLSSRSLLELGLRYRFENGSGNNEVRLSQQFTYTKPGKNVEIEHRFRFSQRFQEQTSFRARYRFAAILPLREPSINKMNVKLTAEAVWEFGKDQLASYDQRYSAVFDYTIVENMDINFGVEYRWRDFTQSPYHQAFLLTGLEFSLN